MKKIKKEDKIISEKDEKEQTEKQVASTSKTKQKEQETDELANMSSEEINKNIKCGCLVVLQHDKEKGVSYDILVEKEYWLEKQKSTREECIKTLFVPGFRRGHAPKKEVERIISDDYVLNIAAQKASKHASFVINSNKTVKNRADNDFYVVLVKLSKDEIILNYSFIERPIIDIKYLDDFKIKLPEKPRINQSDFQKAVKQQIKARAGKITEVDRAIKIGDLPSIDFTGTDQLGKKIENTEGTDYALEIGSKTFIPGFEEQLIGLKKDEEKEFDITFPEKYFNTSLQGKTAKFKVKVKKVCKIVVPKNIDNDLIKSFKIDNVNDLNSFHNYCHRLIMEEANSNWSQQINNISIEELLQVAKLEIDKKIITSEINAITHSLSEQARINKLSAEEVAVRSGIDPKHIQENIIAIAKKRVKLTIIIREYIKNKKIMLQEKEINDNYDLYKKNLPADTAEADIVSKQAFSQNMIRNTALKSIIEKIYENSDRLAQAQRRKNIKNANIGLKIDSNDGQEKAEPEAANDASVVDQLKSSKKNPVSS